MDKTTLGELRTLLAIPLSTTDGNELANQLVEVEAWQGLVSEAARSASQELSEARRRMLLPKSKDYTDMDRTVGLEGSVALEQYRADHLSDLQDIIKRRISLGQSLIKNLTTELNSGLRL